MIRIFQTTSHFFFLVHKWKIPEKVILKQIVILIKKTSSACNHFFSIQIIDFTFTFYFRISNILNRFHKNKIICRINMFLMIKYIDKGNILSVQ